MAEQTSESKQQPKATKARGLEAVAHFEVVAEHDPNVVNGPAEGQVHLRAVAGDGDGARLVLPAGTTIVAPAKGAKLGQRFALRLPLERVGRAAAADDDDGDE
jgi:hypothetical protein